jgi:class 3 adenylate cyclase
MADVTPLEEKLGEVIGLAEAAQEATEKVASLLEDDSQADLLQKIREESEETTKRSREAAEKRNGDASGVLEKAEETKQEGVEMMESYLDEESDGLDGFEFLIMTEAGEAGHWAILGKLNEKAGEGAVGELVDWALPVQERHLQQVRDASLELAAQEDPDSE